MTLAARVTRNHARTFTRANLTALIATAVDFTVLVVLVELLRLYYVPAVALGALSGAVSNFALNRYWAFESRAKAPLRQGIQYAAVSLGSLLLNTSLVYCLTEIAGLKYVVSKLLAAVSVGWLWNYPLHRFFVFTDGESK